MSNLREAYAATAMAGLEWNEDAEKAIDRVAAAGFADALGIALWRSKYLNESKSYHDATKLLVTRYREGWSRFETQGVVEAIVDQVLHEHLSGMCRVCNGAKELIVGDLRVICTTCGGVGVRRFSDTERAQTMKLSIGRVTRLGRAMQWLAGVVSASDRAVNSVMVEQLERNQH